MAYILLQNAKDMGPALLKAGFVKIPASETVQIGDVWIYNALPATPTRKAKLYGHIQIKTKDGWVSDYIQNPDGYPGDSYRKAKAVPRRYRFQP